MTEINEKDLLNPSAEEMDDLLSRQRTLRLLEEKGDAFSGKSRKIVDCLFDVYFDSPSLGRRIKFSQMISGSIPTGNDFLNICSSQSFYDTAKYLEEIGEATEDECWIVYQEVSKDSSLITYVNTPITDGDDSLNLRGGK